MERKTKSSMGTASSMGTVCGSKFSSSWEALLHGKRFRLFMRAADSADLAGGFLLMGCVRLMGCESTLSKAFHDARLSMMISISPAADVGAIAPAGVTDFYWRRVGESAARLRSRKAGRRTRLFLLLNGQLVEYQPIDSKPANFLRLYCPRLISWVSTLAPASRSAASTAKLEEAPHHTRGCRKFCEPRRRVLPGSKRGLRSGASLAKFANR